MGKAAQISWSESTSAGLILVSGGEEFLASRFIRNVKIAKRKDHPELEVTEIDAGEYESGRLYELTAPSLFGEERLIVVSGVERCTDALIEDGLTSIGDLAADCTLIFRHSTGVRGKKLLESVRAMDTAVEVNCEKVSKEVDRIAFANAEFKLAKRAITNGAVRALVESFGDDVAGLAAACAQLMQDVTENIDESVVERYFSGRAEVDTFKIIDAAIAGDGGTALALLRQAFQTGAEPASMIGAFAHRLRVLGKLINNRSATPGQLGIQPWQIEKARKELVGWTEQGMANVFSELARVDAASKGVERAPEFTTERFILLVASKGIHIVS